MAGFGGMINRSRAKAQADLLGISSFINLGRTFGPHGKMVVAFPTHDKEYYNARQAEELSLLTGHANYAVREKGSKPYLGPYALIVEGLRRMYGKPLIINDKEEERIVYTSPFLPSDKADRQGAFFGSRVQYHPIPEAWTPRVEQPYLTRIMEILQRVHQYVEMTSYHPETMEQDPFTLEQSRHPAFHPSMLEIWMEKVSSIDN